MLPAAEYERIVSKSDCAIIPSLIKHHQANCAAMLDGQFAFVAHNVITGHTIAARDHMGICPLYYGWAGDGSIIFASEMKALQEACVAFEEFPPGHYYDDSLPMQSDDFRAQLKRYYSPAWWCLQSPIPTGKPNLTVIRVALETAVQKRLMSDVPFGVLLSGGLDSSIVAAVLCKELRQLQREKERLATQSSNASPSQSDGEHTPPMMVGEVLRSFSIGLEGAPDLIAAKRVSQILGTKHQEFTFTVQEGIDAISEIIYFLETYDVTTIRASIPLYLLSRCIRANGFKFVLSGEGADEIFGGYLYFHKAPNPAELHRETQRKLHALHYYDVLRANKASMAAGLEVRVPFLDKAFLDVAMSIDPQAKMCRTESGEKRMEKAILREAFEGYLPKEILWRQKEQFSDGVGYNWIDSLKEYASKAVSDRQMQNASAAFPHNTPCTKEAYYYRMIFSQHFKSRSAEQCVPGGPSIACSTAQVMHWDENFRRNADQSGRSVLGVHLRATEFKDAKLSAPKST